MILTFRDVREESNQKVIRHFFNMAGKSEFSKFKFLKLFFVFNI
jgi:hypothetical protein